MVATVVLDAVLLVARSIWRIIIAAVAVAALVPAISSYRLWRQEKRQAQRSE
jgi:hypothetical protein